MHLKNILRYLGIFLIISGSLSLLPVFVGLIYGEDFIPSIISGLSSLFFGFILVSAFKPSDLDFGEAMLLGAISLLIISLFGAIPFFFVLEGSVGERVVDSYLESVSGYTTTGMSILPKTLLIPYSTSYHTLVFRRVLYEWIGGLGVVILFLSILARGGYSTVYLYKEEGGKMIVPSIEHTARIIFRLYLFFTIFGVILLWILNVDLFHALASIMSNLSTGGFIFLDPGFQVSPLIMLILSAFMIIGAIPFALHYTLLEGKLKNFLNNIEIKTMLWLVFGFVLIFIFLGFDSYQNILKLVYDSSVTVISTLTTTGHPMPFQTIPELQKFLLIILVVIGAGAGSTAGGIKLIRFSVLTKAIFWLTRKTSLPETAIFPFKIQKKVLEEKEVRAASLFFFIYIILIVLSSSMLIFYGENLTNSLLLAASAQGTSSLTPIEIRGLAIPSKIVLIFQMIAGRLEIFPILALIGYFLRKTRKEVKVVDERIELEMRLKVLRKLRRL